MKSDPPPKKQDWVLTESIASEDLATYTYYKPTTSQSILNVFAIFLAIGWLWLFSDPIIKLLLGSQSGPGISVLDHHIITCAFGEFVIILVFAVIKGMMVRSISLILMRGVGIEIVKTMLNGKVHSKFVPITRVREIIIYEVDSSDTAHSSLQCEEHFWVSVVR